MPEYVAINKAGMGYIPVVEVATTALRRFGILSPRSACDAWQAPEICELKQQLSARAHALRTATTDEQFGFGQSQLAAALVGGYEVKNRGRGNVPANEWDQFIATLNAAYYSYTTQTTSPSGVAITPPVIAGAPVVAEVVPAVEPSPVTPAIPDIESPAIAEVPFYKQDWFYGLVGIAVVGTGVAVYMHYKKEEEPFPVVGRRTLSRSEAARRRLMLKKFPGLAR